MQGCLPEGKSSLVAGEEGWWLVVVPVGLEEQGPEEQVGAPSPASAEGWACFPGSTGPGSGGKCLEDKRHIFVEMKRDDTGLKCHVLHDEYLRAAQLGRPGQTAPTSAVTTAWQSTPGCQTYRGGRLGT